MKLQRREYQESAIVAVEAHYAADVRSVLLVAPTGSGKTELGCRIVGSRSALWVAHTRELVKQTAQRLRERLGSVGVIMAGEYESPARVQVGTVQTLIARERHPDVELVVLDEAHHYLADTWHAFVETYPNALFLGLTATPERQTGEPLGDVFERLVVAANYSELVRDGYLVPARVLQPPQNLGNDLAQDPLDAWVKHAEGSQAFCFGGRVQIVQDWAQRWRGHGVLTDTIHADTPKRERDEAVARFRRGQLRCLMNVNTLTEGVDVPEARTAILARAFGHVGGYLQAVGRVLRPAYGKPDAIVIDLTGATIRHGLPTQDRVYSLTGRAISGGFERPGGGGSGGFEQTIKGVELHMAAPGAWKPSAVPSVELAPIDESERRAEFLRLRDLARKHRMRDGFASARYREKFGEEPRREWR